MTGGEPRRRPQQERSESLVESIVDAARSLLRDHEPAGLTARAIAERAGVAPASVYRYFRDVDEVIDIVLRQHADVAERTIAEALAGSTHRTVPEVYEFVVSTYLDLYRRRPELTVAWRSATLADRQRVIEAESDRGLALALGAHLVHRGLLDRLDARRRHLLVAHWATAGALLGQVLQAPAARRRMLEAELLALVRYLADRLTTIEAVPSARTVQRRRL